MPGARMAKKMPPNLASGLKRTKASEELERVRGWAKAAVKDSGVITALHFMEGKPMDGAVEELLGRSALLP